MDSANSIFDQKVDHIGFVNELDRQFVGGDAGIKAKLKARMEREKAEFAEGECFEAALIGGNKRKCDARTVRKLLRRLKDGDITEAEFCCAVDVVIREAEKLFSEKEFAAMVEVETQAPALRVVRKKGVEIVLVDAVRKLAAQF